MAHARANDLRDLRDVLEVIRALPGVTERRPGVFSGVGRADGDRVFRTAVRHSKQVRILRIAVPAGSIPTLGLVLLVTGTVVTEYLKILKAKHPTTSAYHARTNGKNERFNGILTGCISKLLTNNNKPTDKWDNFLDDALFACRIRLNKSTGYSPFFLKYGFHPHLPGDTLPISFANRGRRLVYSEGICVLAIITAALLTGFGDRYAFARMNVKFPTSGLAVLDFPVEGWAEVKEHQGRLDRFVTPASLDASVEDD